MIIKILSDGGEFVAEAQQYRLHKKLFDDEEKMWAYVRDFADHYVPFSLEAKGAREVLILQITEPSNSVILVTDCHVFVMNNQGKTIDRFSVTGELPKAD